MRDCFYILETRKGWFQLIIGGVFYCVSAGNDLDLIFRIIREYVRKYKTKENLLRKMDEAMRNSPNSIVTYQLRKEEIIKKSYKYSEEVDSIIDAALEENRKDTPLARNLKKKIIPLLPAANRVQEQQSTIMMPRKIKPFRPLVRRA